VRILPCFFGGKSPQNSNREGERDSPDSRSASVESKTGKRQKPAPLSAPGQNWISVPRNWYYHHQFFPQKVAGKSL